MARLSVAISSPNSSTAPLPRATPRYRPVAVDDRVTQGRTSGSHQRSVLAFGATFVLVALSDAVRPSPAGKEVSAGILIRRTTEAVRMKLVHLGANGHGALVAYSPDSQRRRRRHGSCSMPSSSPSCSPIPHASHH